MGYNFCVIGKQIQEFFVCEVQKHNQLKKNGQVQWLKPITPVLWEAKAGRSQDQEFETIFANMVKPRLY